MKISRTELQEYFNEPLPQVDQIAEVFTFHSFEIDGIEGDVLDVKVLPNRAADCSDMAGVARELAALLDVSLKEEKPPTYSTTPVVVTLQRLHDILGATFTTEEVLDVFRRLRFQVVQEGETFTLYAPDPRTDMCIPEDVAEEVGRVLGYDRVVSKELPTINGYVDQDRFRGTERMKDGLIAEGFDEVSTQSFSKKGDIYMLNPMDKTKPALRTSLESNLEDSLARAKLIAPLILAPNEKPRLFEVGTVFPKSDEHIELRMTEAPEAWGKDFPTVDNLTVAKLSEYGKDYEPKRYTLGAYVPFSVYPFITRDIAAWVPEGTSGQEFEALIHSVGGELLLRVVPADRFEKEGRLSLAYRLIFQAKDRTLTDEEVNAHMEKVSRELTEAGYEVR